MNTTASNPELTERRIGECVSEVLCGRVRRATAYISPKLTVKATAQRRIDRRDWSATVLVTVGRPNTIERKFIKVCQKAGMCFPLRQIQWKHWAKKGRK